MKIATIQSVCECQSRLSAEVDEHRRVLGGFARRRAVSAPRELAPAHTSSTHGTRFQVAWACPHCGRNTLRSFETSGLEWRDVPSPNAATNAG